MSPETVTTIISNSICLIGTMWVGRILYTQIKAQKSLIDQYKGYMEAVSPEKVKMLHNYEIELITSLNNQTQQQLKQQVVEMGWFVTETLKKFEASYESIKKYDPDFVWSAKSVILGRMPECTKVLDDISQEYDRQVNTPKP